MLARPFGNDDDRVSGVSHSPLQGSQESLFALQRERDLGHQREVDFLAHHRSPGGNEAGVSPHQLDEADAVHRAAGFDVSTLNDLGRLLQSCRVPESEPDEGDIVVDGLGMPTTATGAPRRYCNS